MIRTLLILAACFLSLALNAPAQAEAPSAQQQRDDLFKALRQSPSPAAAGRIAKQIVQMWRQAPSAEAGRLFSTAQFAMDAGELFHAEMLLDAAIEAAPTYAEAWNQRALIKFQNNRFDAALEDIDQALTLEPKHFGAMTGKALILIRQGRAALAHKTLEQALEINPWISFGGAQAMGQDI